jgi:hypothetical protein
MNGPRKSWQEMSTREIIAQMIAFLVICGLLIAVTVGGASMGGFWSMLYCGAGAIFCAVALTTVWVQALRELSSRRAPSRRP